MIQKEIYIASIGSISPLGSTREQVWNSYLDEKHFFSKTKNDDWIAVLSEQDSIDLEQLRGVNKKYKDLDRTVLLSILASRKALRNANWENGNFGINIGSSRGATELFEKYYDSFLQNNRAETLSSPTTTLGNISSWVANDLKSEGPNISHSVTCSTALHGLLNGVAWLNSGMSEQFLVGGSEAPNTAFTIAQMKALKIYARNNDTFPCKSLDFSKKENTMILGEGAVSICLSKEKTNTTIGKLEGIGFGNEELKHNISISENGDCLQKSMKMALGNTSIADVDAIVMHAPGTIKGDSSEMNAIKEVFKESLPLLTSNKWKLGHALGASGVLSVELALLMLEKQQWIESPFYKNEKHPKQLNKILINAVGFGGNAVSVLISKI